MKAGANPEFLVAVLMPGMEAAAAVIQPVDKVLGVVAEGTYFDHVSDNFEITYKIVTVPTGDSISMYFRNVDVDNHWLLNLDPVYYDMRAFVGGVLSASHGYIETAAVNGSVIKITCISNTIKVYTDNVLKITYNGATELDTAAQGKVHDLGVGGAVSDIYSWRVDVAGKHINP